jgi:hypothetical protein
MRGLVMFSTLLRKVNKSITCFVVAKQVSYSTELLLFFFVILVRKLLRALKRIIIVQPSLAFIDHEATMNTPKFNGSQTDDVVQLAEDMAEFLGREKIQAQKCLHDCERLLNDPKMKSASLKDGLRELRSKTEDNFGTLLHLERVMRMKNLGDVDMMAIPGAPIRSSSAAMTIAASAPAVSSIDNYFRKRGKFRSFEVSGVDDNDDVTDVNNFNDPPLRDDLLFSGDGDDDRSVSDCDESTEKNAHNEEDVDDFDEDSGEYTCA